MKRATMKNVAQGCVVAVLLLTFMLAAISARASDVPDPTYCSVGPWDSIGHAVVSPGIGSGVDEVTISVRNCDNYPTEMADVEIDFVNCPNLCFDSADAGLDGQTDADGILVLDPRVGGCQDCEIRVRANGVTIAMYNAVRSMDWSGSEGDGVVNAVDLAFFASAFLSTQNTCADYNNDGSVAAVDFSMFATAFNSLDRNDDGCAK